MEALSVCRFQQQAEQQDNNEAGGPRAWWVGGQAKPTLASLLLCSSTAP